MIARAVYEAHRPEVIYSCTNLLMNGIISRLDVDFMEMSEDDISSEINSLHMRLRLDTSPHLLLNPEEALCQAKAQSEHVETLVSYEHISILGMQAKELALRCQLERRDGISLEKRRSGVKIAS